MPVADSTLSAPSSVDWSYFLSDAAKRYTPSAIRGSFDLLDTPGILSLLAGEPDPASFPFDHLEFSVKPIDPDGKSEVVKLSGKELEDGLQYGGESTLGPWSASLTLGRDAPAPPLNVWLTHPDSFSPLAGSAGFPALIQWFKTLQSVQHKREIDNTWGLAIGSGSLDLVTKVFGALINPGDSVLVSKEGQPELQLSQAAGS